MKIIEELEQKLRAAADAYYNSDKPVMSDAEFDKLRDDLERLDKNSSFLQEIGSPPSTPLSKVAHRIKMGSLKKINKVVEFETWIKTLSKTVQNLEMAISMKLDGISIELVYRDGKFVQAITRGDGDVGEDVTHTIKNAKGFPRSISIEEPVSVRCEALLTISSWINHFANKKNPRNAASGLVRRTDAWGSKHLLCVAFDVLFDGSDFITEEGRIRWLKSEGFKVTKTTVVRPNGVERAVGDLADQRDSLNIEIDGAVVKLNNLAEQEKLGEHNGIPYWARAWKFVAMGGHTTLKGVEWKVGTQGTINPVAKVAPVEVGGTTIRNVTLHNMDEIERLGIAIGDTIEVIRAGDVIPKIVRVVSKGKNRQIIEIPQCPACGSKALREGPKLVCSKASECGGAQFKRIQKWIKKREIMFLGDSTLQTLWDANLVRTITNLYGLTVDAMVAEGLGKRTAERILEEIEKSRVTTLSNFIGSLSIDMLGRSEAANLVGHGCDTLSKWRALTADQIESFPGYQHTKATRISAGLESNRQLIDWLSAELAIDSVSTEPISIRLAGKSFCFTGAMINPRKELEQKVVDAGGKVSSVSKGLTYLVIADPTSTSSKAKKAKNLGVMLISEDEFIKMWR